MSLRQHYVRTLKVLSVCLAWMAMGVVALAQTVSTTTVQGTVYTANGAPSSGTLQLSWPAFTTASGQAVAAGKIATNIGADGFVSVNLAPNLGSSPAGLYYTAIYHLHDGTTSTEFWVVPAAAQASIAQVRSQVMPAAQAVQAVSKAYVDQAIQSVAQGNLTSTGGQLTGPLYLTGDPTQTLQAADKHYVDSSLAQAVPMSGGAVNGPLTAQQLGAIYQVDQFAGADFGAKLQSCIAKINSTFGGTCDARNFGGTLAMAANITISTANTTVALPCATISTANQIVITAGTRNVSLRGCALRGASSVSGSQGGTVLLYSGATAAIQVGDISYAADTNGFHLDDIVINTTASNSATAQAFAAYRTQEIDLQSLYLLGNANQTGITLDGTGNYTGGTFYDNHISGFQIAINGVGHQITNSAATDWLNASTFVRLHIDCPTTGGSPIAGTYGINLQQGDGNTFTGGDVENCGTAFHLGANAVNNTIVGLRNENSTYQVVADAGSSYNDWMTGGTMFTGKLTDNGTRNSFLDTFHRSFNSLNGDWYGSQQDATLTNHLRLGVGSGNERGLLDRYQTDYGYRWTMGLSDATGGEQFYQVLDELNSVYRFSIGQFNSGQSSTNNQTVINAAGTGAVVLNGSNNGGTGGVVFGSGGANANTVATVSNSGNAQFNGTLQVGGTAQSAGTLTVRNNADAEVDYYLWPGLTGSQKGSFTYKDYNGNSQWYMVKDTGNNWALNSATGGLDSIKAYQSTNSGDTYINASNGSGVVRVNYETGAGSAFNVYGGSSSNLYASFSGNTSIKFPGLSASSGHNCMQIDSAGYITNTGAACGTGNGTLQVADPPGGPATALQDATQHYADSSQMINVTSLGCSPSASASTNTACFQAMANALTGLTYFIPAGTYNLNACIQIPLATNFHIVGASWGSTTLNQTANNTCIFQFKTESANRFSIERLHFNYSTPQTPTGNDNNDSASPAIWFAPATHAGGGVYDFVFSELNFENASRGIDVQKKVAGVGVTNPIWGFTMRNIIGENDLQGATINLIQGASQGAPRQRFEQIYSRQNGQGDAVMATNYNEAIFDNIESNSAVDRVFNFGSCYHCIVRSMSIEAHTIDSLGVSSAVISADNAWIQFSQLSMSSAICPNSGPNNCYGTTPTIDYLHNSGGGGFVSLEDVVLSTYGTSTPSFTTYLLTTGSGNMIDTYVGSSSGFTAIYDPSSVVGSLAWRVNNALQSPITAEATSGSNYPSQPFTFLDSYWNGTTFAPNKWTITAAPASTGTNPADYLIFKSSNASATGRESHNWSDWWLQPGKSPLSTSGLSGYIRNWTRDLSFYAVPVITLARNMGGLGIFQRTEVRGMTNAGGGALGGFCMQTNAGSVDGSETMQADGSCSFMADTQGNWFNQNGLTSPIIPYTVTGYNGSSSGVKIPLALAWNAPASLTSVCHDANGNLTDNNCPGGSGGLSGQASGYLPRATSATGSTSPSNIDDGVSTASTVTSHVGMNVLGPMNAVVSASTALTGQSTATGAYGYPLAAYCPNLSAGGECQTVVAGVTSSPAANNAARINFHYAGSGSASNYMYFDMFNSTILKCYPTAGCSTITPVTSDNSTNIATTAWVKSQGYSTNLSGTTASIGGSALALGACASGTVSITGATTSMAVVASPTTYPGDGMMWRPYVSSAGTVTVKVCAAVAGTPTASTYNVRVIQ